uniref:NADH-ubiquinone oxidoreductase chain 4 n=1 Tax=Gordionus alpestris TaxID=1137640 RepID=A0A514ABX6_9BILA|nr:NADH dehydrogenase subunit 4 [Gordionus alpestris]QDH52417.1 NADH dehydrogenase subunit 4 [Gordionus alpestris]
MMVSLLLMAPFIGFLSHLPILTMTTGMLLVMSLSLNFGSLSNMNLWSNTMMNLDSLNILFTLMFISISIVVIIFIMSMESEMFKLLIMKIILGMTMVMLLVSLINKILWFFIFFEMSLIPIMMMIWGWGSGTMKVKAAAFLLLYTSVASTPLLLLLLSLNLNLKLSSWSELGMSDNLSGWGSGTMILIILAFLVKLPIYIFHLWLPKAHVEASTSGSMLLAGSLLKLGVFGLSRMLLILMGTPLVMWILMSTLLWGMIMSSIGMSFSNDGKIMIAYSSVSHMTFLAISMLLMSFISLDGSISMSMSHGFISPSMFLIFYLMYNKMSTRNMILVKSQMNMKSLYTTLILFMILMFNIGCPPSFNLFPEIIIIYNLMNFSYFFMYPIILNTVILILISSFIFTRISMGVKKVDVSSSFLQSSLTPLFIFLFMSLIMWQGADYII